MRIAQASRLVSAKDLSATKEGLKNGDIDIVIGTHALLGKSIDFADLGLLIIDEEQHFGVKHKERLKELREDVHVLTLSATPIPRTLQLAMSGVREMSLIATPPVDRLAVRTYVIAVRSHDTARSACCANASGAGRPSLSCRAFPISTRRARSCRSTCPNCASHAPTGR